VERVLSELYLGFARGIAFTFPQVVGSATAHEIDMFLNLDSLGCPFIEDRAASGMKYEQEVVIHPFSCFKIVSASLAGQNERPLIKLREIDLVVIPYSPPGPKMIHIVVTVEGSE
jgi:hypothetical protein